MASSKPGHRHAATWKRLSGGRARLLHPTETTTTLYVAVTPHSMTSLIMASSKAEHRSPASRTRMLGSSTLRFPHLHDADLRVSETFLSMPILGRVPRLKRRWMGRIDHDSHLLSYTWMMRCLAASAICGSRFAASPCHVARWENTPSALNEIVMLYKIPSSRCLIPYQVTRRVRQAGRSCSYGRTRQM